MNNKSLKKIGRLTVYIPIAFLFFWYSSATAENITGGDERIRQAQELESLINQLKEASRQFTYKTRALVLKANKIRNQNRTMQSVIESKRSEVGSNIMGRLRKRHTVNGEIKELNHSLGEMMVKFRDLHTAIRNAGEADGFQNQLNTIQKRNAYLRDRLPSDLRTVGDSGSRHK